MVRLLGGGPTNCHGCGEKATSAFYICPACDSATCNACATRGRKLLPDAGARFSMACCVCSTQGSSTWQ